jgi:hypothetical protein
MRTVTEQVVGSGLGFEDGRDRELKGVPEVWRLSGRCPERRAETRYPEAGRPSDLSYQIVDACGRVHIGGNSPAPSSMS